MVLSAGSKLGPYEILALIGAGGTVALARSLDLPSAPASGSSGCGLAIRLIRSLAFAPAAGTFSLPPVGRLFVASRFATRLRLRHTGSRLVQRRSTAILTLRFALRSRGANLLPPFGRESIRAANDRESAAEMDRPT